MHRHSERMNQELKDYKKKLETVEEEFQKFKKESNIESSRLVQHYEQRILVLLKSGITSVDPQVLSTEERWEVLRDAISGLEKKQDKETKAIDRRSIKQESGMLGHTQSEYKRATNRVKREHRRTRVIRTEDVEPFRDHKNIAEDIEKSPSRVGMGSDYKEPPTPVDKNDTDWVNPWARTPLKTKNRSDVSFLKKDNLKRASKRSSRPRLAVTQEAANMSSNYENE